MLSIALDLCLRVAAALWATNVINSITGQGSGGFSSQAMQQGGVGLLMTLLIVTTPAMAAAFFQGTLGTFYSYSQVKGDPARGPQGQAPGTYGGYAPQPVNPASNQRPTDQLPPPR
jgi:type IV secretion system protein VirB6